MVEVDVEGELHDRPAEVLRGQARSLLVRPGRFDFVGPTALVGTNARSTEPTASGTLTVGGPDLDGPNRVAGLGVVAGGGHEGTEEPAGVRWPFEPTVDPASYNGSMRRAVIVSAQSSSASEV